MVDKYLKSNWLFYIILIFIISRVIMYYQYDIANSLLLHDKGTFTNVMCKWDCKWYLTIIHDGYDKHIRHSPKVWKGLANWAFFPLYPNIVGIISKVLHTNAINTGIVLNQLFILIASIFFYKLLRLNFNDLNSRFGVTILIFSPFSVYFSSLYTEALFIMLSITGFYYLKVGSGYRASIMGGLLSATRPVGIMFAVPLIVNFFRRRDFSFKFIICLFLAGSGLALYMLFLKYRADDFLAFAHIQKGWGRRGWDTNHLWRQIWHMISDTHNSIIFGLSVLMSVYILIKKYYEEALFNLACILPGVLTGTMMSEGRFSGTLFTFYFALTIFAAKSWTYKIIILLVSFLLYLSYYIYWVAHAKFLI